MSHGKTLFGACTYMCAYTYRTQSVVKRRYYLVQFWLSLISSCHFCVSKYIQILESLENFFPIYGRPRLWLKGIFLIYLGQIQICAVVKRLKKKTTPRQNFSWFHGKTEMIVISTNDTVTSFHEEFACQVVGIVWNMSLYIYLLAFVSWISLRFR